MERPKFKFEWNLNTIVSIITLLLMVAGGGGAYATINNRLDNNEKKQEENKVEVARQLEATNSRVEKVENKVQEIPLLSVRMDNMASGLSDVNTSVRDFREVLQKLVTQTEVQNQLMRRLERSSGTPRE